ncbi:autoinducer 2 ABC transporter substrate-binding protein [Phyllobacterium endophyticum]|uniref:Autoinducer 2 ABC transporter substrate-binding protein n=1 Tax=Phyllobacterium endophyticum TaxID=1149773 RepID=A0A2P7AQZ4_9HYPH|nr:autoinducer 2 ABC transporter substrate-binding protein [Phyllobacterium endophyticum]MBB3237280.1 rhamnose transport system substrate-binding protein [Phyllobacterium endophyticum]PSH56648.1 autoinducer 2 ABC transporter substrate-binding protein [Phyllobacterium endophyticum]TYR44357.1 substrate-binding domain-containing protein [Phyllobacterium endophyticum]
MRTLLKFAAICLLATTTLASAAEAKDIRVAFVPQIQGIPYYVAMENGAKAAAEKFGVTYVQQGPTATNAADQLRIFESFVNQGFDVVVVSPVDVETLKPAIARATEKGVHVLTSDADAAGSKRAFYVAQAMDKDLGYKILDEMVARVGKEVKIAIISDAPTIASLNNWIAAIQERAKSTYPDLKIVSIDHTDGTAARAFQFATDSMTRNPDLKGIIGIASTTCPGIGQAVEAAGRVGSIVTTGFCSPNTVKDYVMSGAMTYSVLWNPSDLGYLTVWAGKEVAEGKKLDTEPKVDGLDAKVKWLPDQNILLLGDPMVFTKDNIGQFNF